jgi:hypothetical protein
LEVFVNTVKNKKIRNIYDEEFNASKSLKNNNNIIICRTDKSNCAVLLNKEDYIAKAEEILKLKQFRHTDKSLLIEKEKVMYKYILKLFKDKIIDKRLYWCLHYTPSSRATMLSVTLTLIVSILMFRCMKQLI